MERSWVNDEIAASHLGDVRLNRRFGTILKALGERPGKPLPSVFEDWANTKAAYRFFEHSNISEDKLLTGHFSASAQRIKETDGPILILQDTTEFSFKRKVPEKIGFTKIATSTMGKDKRYQKHKVCGLLMHASLAVTPEGLPLGLTAVKFWSRSRFKGSDALKRKINPTRVPINQKESIRWLDSLRLTIALTGKPERCVHIGDRESDIFELYCLANDLGTRFLVRSCVDRLVEDGKTTLSKVMSKTPVSAMHDIMFHNTSGEQQKTTLSIRFATMKVRPPIGKQRKYPCQTLQIIYAQENNPPPDRPAIFWKLITNLPVQDKVDAVRMLKWYARRWSIETFFKTLKTGCQIEEVRLTTTQRLANYIALCCIVAWRISWLTIVARQTPQKSPNTIFTKTERSLLEAMMPERYRNATRNIAFYLIALARLGGYLDRKSDPPPGTAVIWRGFSRLNDINYRCKKNWCVKTYG